MKRNNFYKLHGEIGKKLVSKLYKGKVRSLTQFHFEEVHKLMEENAMGVYLGIADFAESYCRKNNPVLSLVENLVIKHINFYNVWHVDLKKEFIGITHEQYVYVFKIGNFYENH